MGQILSGGYPTNWGKGTLLLNQSIHMWASEHISMGLSYLPLLIIPRELMRRMKLFTETFHR